MSTQHVVFRYTPELSPTWTYYSMPASAVGGGETLAAARQNYREALAFHEDVAQDTLPEMQEHTERELVPGVWVRVARDEHLGDRESAFPTLALLLKADMTLVQDLQEYPTAGGEAVVLASYPDDRLASIREEMTPYDTVWIATVATDSSSASAILWIPFAGGDAEGIDPETDHNVAELGLSNSATVLDLVNALNEAQYLSKKIGVAAPVLV